MSDRNPNLVQRVRYIYGATLPTSMSDWVIEDLTGRGAARRYLTRFLVPILPVLALFLLVPAPMWVGLSMMSLLYLPLVYFAIALMYVYRRHRLAQHGLDPDLADIAERRRADAERATYELRYGHARSASS